MKKYFFSICYFLSSVALAGVGVYEGEWIFATVNDKKQECNGNKFFYSNEGGGSGVVPYGWNKGAVLCLHKNNANKAFWIIQYSDTEMILGKHCIFESKKGWLCKKTKISESGFVYVEPNVDKMKQSEHYDMYEYDRVLIQ